jgi:hypothetical protein
MNAVRCIRTILLSRTFFRRDSETDLWLGVSGDRKSAHHAQKTVQGRFPSAVVVLGLQLM